MEELPSTPALDERPARQQPRWREWTILLAILLVAAGLRVYQIDRQSFWFDEFASVELPMGRGYAQYSLPSNVVIPNPPNLIDLKNARPIRELWYSEVQGHMPPLYPMVTRLWIEAFGAGPVSARALSVVFSLIAIVLLYFAVHELTGPTPALWAAAVMTLAGAQIQYAQEARTYSLLLTEGLAAAVALARIEKRGPTLAREGFLTLAVLAMTVTHYFAAGTIVALAVYAGVRLRGLARKRAILCFVIAAIGWGILGAPVASRQRNNLNDTWSTEFLRDDAPGNIVRTAQRLAKLPVRFFTEPTTGSLPAASIGAVAFVVAAVLPRKRPDLLLWGLWFGLTILPLVALDLVRRTQHLEFVRYTLLASPALYALVACALSDFKGWRRHVVPCVILVSCLLALPQPYHTWWKPDWRGLARSMDRAARPGDLTVFWRGTSWEPYPNSAYLHTTYYRQIPVGPIVLMQGWPDEALRRELRAAPGLLIVTQTPEDPEAALADAKFQWCGYEAGCGGVWRVTWPKNAAPAATTRSSDGEGRS